MKIEVNAKRQEETGEVEKIEKKMEAEPKTTIEEVLYKLGYEDSLKSFTIVVNGRKKGLDYELHPDDSLTVFPPMTGG